MLSLCDRIQSLRSLFHFDAVQLLGCAPQSRTHLELHCEGYNLNCASALGTGFSANLSTRIYGASLSPRFAAPLHFRVLGHHGSSFSQHCYLYRCSAAWWISGWHDGRTAARGFLSGDDSLFFPTGRQLQSPRPHAGAGRKKSCWKRPCKTWSRKTASSCIWCHRQAA